MWLANAVGKIPFVVRLVSVLVVFATLLALSGPIIFNHVGFFLLLLFILFFDRILMRTEHKPIRVEDPVAVIRREADTLIVLDQRVDANSVTRLALGATGDTGYLQFPFNPKFKVRLVFPADQVAPLSMHLKTLLSDVTLVE